jgi:uncharacterized surface protein with fasciclin (FAS1) repeats
LVPSLAILQNQLFSSYWRNILNKKSIIIGLVATFGFISNAMADNLLEAMDSDGGYKILLGAIKTAGLESTFKGAGPLTVFAPTDDAFKALPKAKLDELLKNPAELKKVISYSVVPAKVTGADVTAGKVKSLEGEDIKLDVTGGVKVNGIGVVSNSSADNGVIHGVNTLLMPKS